MIRLAFVATFALCSGPVKAAGAVAPARPAGAQTRSGIIALSLIEALAAIRQPALAGVFTFVAEKDSAAAFANYLVRDMKAIKRYTDKLDDDRDAAKGLSQWDHEVCANLINFYSSPAGGAFGRPDQKRMSKINQCILSKVLSLETVVAARKK